MKEKTTGKTQKADDEPKKRKSLKVKTGIKAGPHIPEHTSGSGDPPP